MPLQHTEETLSTEISPQSDSDRLAILRANLEHVRRITAEAMRGEHLDTADAAQLNALAASGLLALEEMGHARLQFLQDLLTDARILADMSAEFHAGFCKDKLIGPLREAVADAEKGVEA